MVQHSITFCARVRGQSRDQCRHTKAVSARLDVHCEQAGESTPASKSHLQLAMLMRMPAPTCQTEGGGTACLLLPQEQEHSLLLIG